MKPKPSRPSWPRIPFKLQAHPAAAVGADAPAVLAAVSQLVGGAHTVILLSEGDRLRAILRTESGAAAGSIEGNRQTWQLLGQGRHYRTWRAEDFYLHGLHRIQFDAICGLVRREPRLADGRYQYGWDFTKPMIIG